MTKTIMFQSTLSGSGKSLITAAVCRHYFLEGRKVSPFKALNISLNSYVTKEGREIGISQAFQAWASGKEPCNQMNPLLYKATGNSASQLMINGLPYSTDERHIGMENVRSAIIGSFDHLKRSNDVIVIEGSGSPSEINLQDIANMSVAEMACSPVILIGDIDTGGVFAGLYGTYRLLQGHHKRLVKGFIINKFRGERSILESGIRRMEVELGVPCLGVLPYQYYDFPSEDSLCMPDGGSGRSGVEDIRTQWMLNLDCFLEMMKAEMDMALLNKILEEGI
ncbi:MAG: cobyric acid synthase [Candidatus Methanofastidiosa archaeon]|nr:cobyric acid synthase [Candidatus Methanofastidiosa archaeon]